ncbi:hypothetical protein [uncultured Sphingomonas sp.]|uniref:hypothetical protein n=1 Tax=uncultured Sphingomonas sp. TaxID=158754 RepID=UPI0025F802B5|nr:hypothetical protein [uncultured Sphingomonas sp.]
MNNAVRFRSPEQFRREAVAQVAPGRPIRRIEVPVTDPALAQTDHLLSRHMAEELEFAWRQLNSLANGIARDGIMAARHGTAVPTLDAVGQLLGQLAVVLRSAKPDNAVDRIPSTELRARLQRKGSVE